MAACSVFVQYPIQHPSSGEMASSSYQRRGSSGSTGGFIRDELMFTPSHGSTNSSFPRGAGETFPSCEVVDKRASLLQEYFKSTNALTRSIMLEKSTVENKHGHSWTVLSDSRRDEIVNNHFVPSDVREQYTSGGLVPRNRSLCSRLSDYSQESSVYDEEIIRPSSQPMFDVRKQALSKTKSLTHTPTFPANQMSDFSRNKLRSYSIKLKKSPVSSRKLFTDEVVPLFERDVNDLDNDIDLPDESLINDHVDSPTGEETFQRLRPLRYSFGRKLRHHIEHTQSSTDLSKDYIIANEGTISPSLQDLSQVGSRPSSQLDYTDSMSDINRQSNDQLRLTAGSPIYDDMLSISSSRQSIGTPEPQLLTRGRLSVRTESPLKHPLSRSVRAGSSYMTATSELADRRQMFKNNIKRKANSANSTRENTPLPTDIPDLPPNNNNSGSADNIKKETGKIPTITTTYLSTDNNNSSSGDLVSPMCSPPASPAAHSNPATIYCSKRESGYISSLEASDEEEGHNSQYNKSKRRNNRVLHVENSRNYL